MSLSRTGTPAVHFVPCGDHRVRQVTLFELTNANLVGGEEDIVLWRIRSDKGGVTRRYEVGVVPQGFRLVSGDSAPALVNKKSYAFVVETTAVDGHIVFRLPVLDEEVLTADKKHLTEKVFIARALERCS